jgi:thioredoxin reductase (NADPH)
MTTPEESRSSRTLDAWRNERAFPVLAPQQVQQLAAGGRRRAVTRGDVLLEVGDKTVPLFLVVSGELEILRPAGTSETTIVALSPGQFSGEASLITGRRSFSRIRVRESGEVIQLDRDHVLSLVQANAELSEILMRAFLLRRAAIIAVGYGDVVVIGSSNSAGTLRVKEFLSRNGHPFQYIDLDHDAEAQEFLDRFDIAVRDVPVLLCGPNAVLRNPTNARLAECLGFNETIDPKVVRDLVIVGAGPAGLAAAVYGASEGLKVLVIEADVPGGQAGSSSRIENYLGFPTGISGLDLTTRAYAQAQKFGAEIMIAKRAAKLACERQPYSLDVGDDSRVSARTLIIATGAQYRRPQLDNLAQFEGAGVYYLATPMEAQLCVGDDVIVVGGGNSAGQAAVFLAQTAKRVHLYVRGEGLAATMSKYLIRRIEENAAIIVRTRTEIVGLEGRSRLERVRWRDNRTGRTETTEVAHVFVMTGAVPNTGWLNGCVALDDKGFVKTGPDLSSDDLTAFGWPLKRQPHLLETSRPGLFAVGDVRARNVKRVASAVGEGSIAVSFIHKVLQRS